MHDTIDLALGEYPRLMAIRVDLRFPKLRNNEKSGNVMTDFLRSLQSQIDHSGKRKKREGSIRVMPFT
nr:inovirus Gp2 family protein [Vibrio tarriae]